ncbi:MAG: hypothetical protein ABEJ24_02070 [Candidatus Magasanikbacteria bacterium]
MNYLLLDPTIDEKLKLILFSEDEVISKDIKKVKAEKYLESLDSFLDKNELNINDIEGLIVLSASGRFTANRIATTIANTVRFIEDVSLLAVDKNEADDSLNTENIQTLSELRKKLESSGSNYISAKYSGEPNIN